MLSISNYHKSYHGRTILDIPELNVEHGIYWLKGINGSGKSTLFKSICGTIPFKGNISLDGKSVKKDKVTYRKMVGFCEAEPQFPPFLTQKDLISFTSSTKGQSPEQVEHIVSQLGTSEYMHQSVGTYSSGMLKKTGLSMAFIGNLKLIVLDEPFITIDKESTERLANLILKYFEKGTTFLISSHTQDGSEDLPISRVFQISDKRLVAE